jgi:sulfopyruvate decarboxylase subunit beta
MKRYDVIKELINFIEDNDIIVSNIGIPSKELYAIKDRDTNFYMTGSMGLASSIALGLAISRPVRKVWCIEGDGALLMNLGSLATIANLNPPNLCLIVIDNSVYGSTGNQATRTAGKTDLAAIAKGAGFDNVLIINEEKDIKSKMKKLAGKNHFILIKAQPGNKDVPNIGMMPEEIKERFIGAIGKLS